MENEIVEKILGVDIKVITDKGEERTVSISDLVGVDGEKTSLSINGAFSNEPHYKINLHIECDGYGWKIN